MPKVSIIVPIYNVEKYLKRCLNSLINQTLKEIEIICVNDGSTDGSLKILEEFTKLDDRITVLNQVNAGVSAARNAGLKVSSGEYIGFVDSDDWVDLDYYEKLYSFATKNDCDIAITNVVRKKETTQKYKIKYAEEQVYENLQEKLDICDIPNCCYIVNKIYRAEIIKDSNFKEGVFFEDVLWLPEIIKGCNKLVTVPSVVYYYWVNNNSIVRSKSTTKRENDSYNAKKYIVQFYDENYLKLSKKERNITKSIKHILNIPVLKVKEYNDIEYWYLFGIVPIFLKFERKKLRKKIKTYINGFHVYRKAKKVGKHFYCGGPSRVTKSTVLKDYVHFNGMHIMGNGNVIIGNHFHSGIEVLIITQNHNYDKGTLIPYDDTFIFKDVIIEDFVWIGSRVMILPGTKIGEGAIIQGGSVVHGEIPPYAIAGGNPAKVFKYRDIEHFKKLKAEGKYKR